MKTIIAVIVIGLLFGLLYVTRNINYQAPASPRPINVTQDQTEAILQSAKGDCEAQVKILDQELPHGESISAKPLVTCPTPK